MHADKRRWIYDGMAIPAGIALGERKPKPSVAAVPHRVLLVGPHAVTSLGAVLRRLLSEHGVALGVAASPSNLVADWLERGWLADALRRHAAELVLCGLLRPSAELAGLLEDVCTLRGARVLWLFDIGLMADMATMAEAKTASEVAACAALLWQSIRQPTEQRAYDG